MKKSLPEWFGIVWEEHNYLPDTYYDDLLKPYVFEGKDDLEIFADELGSDFSKRNVLELGCGTGRATEVFRSHSGGEKLTLLDLSETMISAVQEKFQSGDVEFVCSDSLQFLKNNTATFDYVYSLWSLSHSIHQTIENFELLDGYAHVEEILEKFIRESIVSQGELFLLHFDSRSEEQTILMRQWSKMIRHCPDESSQSHSFSILNNVFQRLQAKGIVEYSVEHLKGEPILYENIDVAVETFVNFHLEGAVQRLQNHESAMEIISSVDKYLRGFMNNDGTVSVAPGCFVFRLKKMV